MKRKEYERPEMQVTHKGEEGYCSIGLGDDDDGAINGTVTIGGVDKGNGVTDSPYVYQL